jgi:argininosuccinate lyase
MTFAPEYVSCVLNEQFRDAQELFLAPLVAIHHAHLVMLADRRIVSAADARALRGALEALALEDIGRAGYDGTCEDLFFYVERLITARAGEDVAGRLHTARSRNDIDMTMYRMKLREFLLALIGATDELRDTLLQIAGRHRETVLAAHTHTQPAQPTTIAHYLIGAVEQLERDHARLAAAYDTTNRCPLGSCAITGTGFDIDRSLTSDLLGFDAPTGNTYGSIATVDYLLEAASAAAVLLIGLGRVVQDLLLWCTMEFGYLRLAEGYVQVSSIMPQKRNPVALEHARAIASKAIGQATAILQAVHNTPFGDIVDTEDDLQPLVFTMFRDATRAVRLVGATMQGAEFDVERLAERAATGWITITELADTLAREHGAPFRQGHQVASRLIRASAERPGWPLSELLAEVAMDVMGRNPGYDETTLGRILSPKHFVEVRRTHGGPAPEETGRAIAESGAALARDRIWSADRATALRAAEGRLASRVEAL